MSLATQIRDLVNAATGSLGESVVTVGRGSGLVIEPGHVLTNAHNIHADLTVRFPDGRHEPAEVAGVDVHGDLAVLTVDTGEARPAPLRPHEASLGEVIVALARPRRRGLVATLGTVSAVEVAFRGPEGQPIHGALEHSARLPRGSSGGPVVDEAGNVVAINTHRRSDGFYVAVPVTEHLVERVERLSAGDSPRRPRLGVAVAPPSVAARLRAAVGLSPRDGLLIRDVDEDSPAAAAGLESGDLLVSVDAEALTSPDRLHHALADAEELTFLVVRGDEEREVTVDLRQ